MIKTTSFALFFLAAGIFTSVTILSAYQILFAIPLIYYTYLAIQNKEFKLPKSAWWLLAFTAVAFLSLVVNYELIPKPSKNFGRLKYFIFGVGGIFVFRVWLNEASDKTKKFILNTFFVSMVVAGIYMIYKASITTEGRISGFTNTMRYGYGTAMISLSIISGLLHRKKISNWFDWKFALPALIFGLIGMYLSQTRGAMLGLICGLPFVLYFYRPKVGLIVGLGSIAILSTLAGFYFFGKITQDSEGPRYFQSKNNRSDVMRRSQWISAIIATKEKPILGWGFSNFHTQVERIKNENDLDAKDYIDAHSHNIYLEIASGTGILGILLFLGWIISWALECFKNDLVISSLTVPFGVAFVTASFFEVTYDANNAVMIFAIYSLSLGIKNVKQS